MQSNRNPGREHAKSLAAAPQHGRVPFSFRIRIGPKVSAGPGSVTTSTQGRQAVEYLRRRAKQTAWTPRSAGLQRQRIFIECLAVNWGNASFQCQRASQLLHPLLARHTERETLQGHPGSRPRQCGYLRKGNHAMVGTRDALGELPLAAAKSQLLHIATWPHAQSHYCDSRNRCSHTISLMETTGMQERGETSKNHRLLDVGGQNNVGPCTQFCKRLKSKSLAKPARPHPHLGGACHSNARRP